MAKLRGLQGMYGPAENKPQQTMDIGVLEARHAPGTAQSHGRYGSQSLGYGGPIPSESPGYRFDTYDAGFSDEFSDIGFPEEDGIAWDQTPSAHGSPYPRGIVETAHGGSSMNTPAGLEIAGEQMAQLHGREMGGTTQTLRHAPAGHEEVTRYTTDRYPAPNSHMLSPNIPGQTRGVPAGNSGGGGSYGMGQSDTVQGYGKLNTTDEFQRGHSIRRIQHDRMPWDFTNTRGEQDVPFLGRHEIRQRSFNGPDSPYFEAGDISGANVPWEGRISYPTPYDQAPEPAMLRVSTIGIEADDVWGY